MCKLSGSDIPVAVNEDNDPWKHRSSKMLCRCCMYYVRKSAPPAYCDDPSGYLGRCRRHAPTLGGFPAVFDADWCGDHKLDENKK